MTDDDFEHLLRRWGRILGERLPSEWGDEVPAGYLPQTAHPLSRVGSPPKLIRQRTTMDRGGHERRRCMGAAAGLRIVPATFVDPVPCTETRTMRDPARDFPLPADVLRVEVAALELYRWNPVRGLCLRMAYCARGSRDEKAARVAQCIGEPVRAQRYKNELFAAKVWIHARVW